MTNMDIALLEDSPADARLIKLHLEASGHRCDIYSTGSAFKKDFEETRHDIVIIDWELPDISGDHVLHWIREDLNNELPVIFVTGRDSTEDIVAMLDAGADDYMTKPVNLVEMLARITALVRRSLSGRKNTEVIEHHPFTLDFSCHRILIDDKEVMLTPKEFELAGYLLSNIGDLIPRETLLLEIWGYGPEIQTRTIDIHISRIRKKLALTEQNGWKLTSIYHRGYRLERLPTA
ncbi:MAG TPA: response regulator transcription factor [Gammaproteobacteria bacterium]|nr:response regulator transcription factor [Gammaproteobacteria bacterium]